LRRKEVKVLIACEFSGITRDAFIAKGHEATSCDLLPTERPGPHLQCDIREVDTEQYDLLIGHPVCTRLCCSGNRWRKNFKDEIEAAIDFFMWFVQAPCKKKAIENPIGIMSTQYRKPDQIIQPWQFGHGETKATCLWLFNLPLLKPTKVVYGRENRIHKMSESKDRWKMRSLTYSGIAEVMAEQWK
jgi:hypothetical protein